MAKYVCKNLGICDKANVEVELVAGTDPQCPECGMAMHSAGGLTDGSSAGEGGQPAKRKWLIPATAAVVILGGLGAYLGTRPSAESNVAVAAVPSPKPAPETPPMKPVPTVVEPSDKPKPDDAQIKALRASGDGKLASGDNSGAENDSRRAVALEMIKLAILDMEKGKLADAESELVGAKAKDPKQPLIYYNMAVIRIRQGRMDDALKELEASFISGFSAFEKLEKDADLGPLKKDERLSALLARYRTAK